MLVVADNAAHRPAQRLNDAQVIAGLQRLRQFVEDRNFWFLHYRTFIPATDASAFRIGTLALMGSIPFELVPSQRGDRFLFLVEA